MHARLRVRQASGIPCALRIQEGTRFKHNSGAFAPREGFSSSLRGAKRRRVRRSSKSEGGSNPYYFLGGDLDCFAEPVIGPRFARTRRLAMSVERVFDIRTTMQPR